MLNSENYVEAETVSEDSEISSLSNTTEGTSERVSTNEILIIEPFYGGSHKQLIDILDHHLNKNLSTKKTCLFKMPAKKWHWRARTSALYFYQNISKSSSYKVLFCSSVLNLAELVALRPDLSHLHKIIYFHENQLVYPVQEVKSRDFQYGYNQILSCLVADVVVFNSQYNMNSFLFNIDKFLRLQPDFIVKNLSQEIKPKCRVLYFPVEVPKCLESKKGNILHIIWPHRWEHDKNPQLFFETLFKLKANKLPFVVSILGQSFSSAPDIFDKAKTILQNEILQFGIVESKDEYFQLLTSGHVVVSTANHEFFGVAVLEAVMSGCFPIVCNNLVYPELFPPECLYETSAQLFQKLKSLCEEPHLAEIYSQKVRPLREGIQKVKDLIQELEESFRESNNISNNLILRCVLLRAENHNLIFKIDQRNSIKPKPSKNEFGSESIENTDNLPKKYIRGEKSKESTLPNSLDTSRTDSLAYDSSEEIDILHNTIEDLQKKMREKNIKFEELCQKYYSLETNKIQMETDLRSQIMSLEEQLNVTNDTLTEFQNENEADIEDTLSSALDPHEALFLQERLRCSKLMYEKVRLHHEIQRLQDVIRRLTIIPKEKDQRTRWRTVKSGVDKASSEPLMKRFQST